ncbi:NUDIX hydrolase [Methylobacterium planeticum]|uniref:GDP-mannose pyrophosphatase n=2 Tax=Methylobacterium planeticum TaxID=2615211 RepID=A0A6N6MV01_9HYPH|nr:NUDIX hydrolase [Methylobacterium planeticum]
MRDRSWTVQRSLYALRDRWISVRADDCTTASGATVAPYYVLEFPDFVHVVALDEAGRVVLVRQYRHGHRGHSLELPGGVMDPGETDLLAVAARELREETGYVGTSLTHLATLSVDPARYANRLHLVRATGLAAGSASPEPTEDIDVVLVPRDEAIRMALSGGIVNAAHVGLLLIGLADGGGVEGPSQSGAFARA